MPGPVVGLPGQSQIFPKQYAGQVKVDDCGNYVFFWFFESQYSPNDPVVLWLNGGPGASSLIGLFQENGPLMLNQAEDGGIKVKARPTSWNSNAHYLVIDQPVGTGLSFSKDSETCAPQNEIQSTEQLYKALQEFFSLYADYSDNDFYIFGESFGGHYIPRLTEFTVNANNGNQTSKVYSPLDIKIHLKGIGIGDGWVDPETQTKDVASYAFDHGFITSSQQTDLQKTVDQCEQQLHKYDNSTMNGTVLVPASVGVNNAVAGKFEAGEMNSMVKFIGDTLSNSSIRVLIYEGVLDGCCGPGGTNGWLKKMESNYWPTGETFINAPYRPWYVGGVRKTLVPMFLRGNPYLFH